MHIDYMLYKINYTTTHKYTSHKNSQLCCRVIDMLSGYKRGTKTTLTTLHSTQRHYLYKHTQSGHNLYSSTKVKCTLANQPFIFDSTEGFCSRKPVKYYYSSKRHYMVIMNVHCS